jgi:hypothetical protein
MLTILPAAGPQSLMICALHCLLGSQRGLAATLDTHDGGGVNHVGAVAGFITDTAHLHKVQHVHNAGSGYAAFFDYRCLNMQHSRVSLRQHQSYQM